MVYQYNGVGFSYKKIAKNINADPSTVQRTIKLFGATETVSKDKYRKEQNHPFTKLSVFDEFLILELVIERPGIYLREIQSELINETETEVSIQLSATFYTKMDLHTRN